MISKDFMKNLSWSRKDMISTEDLNPAEIDKIFAMADVFKASLKTDKTKLPYLKGKVVVNLFSSRAREPEPLLKWRRTN